MGKAMPTGLVMDKVKEKNHFVWFFFFCVTFPYMMTDFSNIFGKPSSILTTSR